LDSKLYEQLAHHEYEQGACYSKVSILICMVSVQLPHVVIKTNGQ